MADKSIITWTGYMDNRREIIIRVEGEGFLYNMVRIIAGTLVKIGGSDMPADAMKGIIAATDRAAAGPTAPAHGLTMIGLKYE